MNKRRTLLLIISFISFFRHDQDMRALIGDRAEGAVQASATGPGAELHYHESNFSSLVALAELSKKSDIVAATDDLTSDFDGGLAYITYYGIWSYTFHEP